ncbi:MAG: acyltransferase [Undibacterium sp.]|nr:acyltransferase [Undibacterium sp.]
MTDKTHLENLTWLRAVAAFFVVVSHSIRTAEVQYAPNDERSYFLPLNLLDLGSFGVCLFFALSGCTLYLSNKDNMKYPNDFIKFYIKRFMRIWPAFAFSMVLYIVFIEIFKIGYIGEKKFWIGQFLNEYSLFNIFQYLTLTFNITGPNNLFVGSYWSLPLEFQYYLLLPFAIFFMTKRFSSIFIPVAFGAVLFIFYKYSFIPVYRDEIFKLGYTFFGGVFLAHAYSIFKFKISALVALGIFVLIISSVGFVVTGRIVIPPETVFISDIWNYYGISAILCVALALFSKPLFLPNGIRFFMNEYGDISYSIYLFHMLFIGIAAIVVTRFGIFGSIQKLTFILGFSLFFSFWFSKLTYKLIELPSIEVGRKLSKKLTKIDT